MTKEQEKLVEKNHDLIYEVLGQMETDVEEFYDVAAISLCNAAINYSEAHSLPFRVYARKRIIKAVKQEFERLSVRRMTEGLSWNCSMNRTDDYEMEQSVCSGSAVEKALACLSTGDRDVLLLYSRGYSAEEVCAILARPGCNIAKVVRKFLCEYIQYMHREGSSSRNQIKRQVSIRLSDSVITGEDITVALHSLLQ